jgi:DNA-binding protein HU-beta
VTERDPVPPEPAERVDANLNFQVIELGDHMVQELRKTGGFTIPGFGTFTIREIKARTRPGRGDSDLINAGGVKTVRFKASPILKQAIEVADPGPVNRQRASPGETSRLIEIDDPMARQLSEGFAEAVRQAVQEAHAAGLAVPARENGIAIEMRPNGEVVPIDDDAPWSPTDWRKSAKH